MTASPAETEKKEGKKNRKNESVRARLGGARCEERCDVSLARSRVFLSPRLLAFYDLKFFPTRVLSGFSHLLHLPSLCSFSPLFQGKPETNARHVSSPSASI